MGWQWHQLDHMQIICTSLQTDNDASTSPLSFFTGRMLFLPPNQQRQSTEGTSMIWYIPIGKQWYQLPEIIPFNTDSGLHHRISISIHTQHVTQVAELIHTSRFALVSITTLVWPVLVTGFEQPLQINDFITSYTLPFILLYLVPKKTFPNIL